MEKLKVGDRAIYSEDGEKDLVEILETKHDDKWWRFRLRVIEVIQPSPYMKPSELGEEATVERTKGDFAYGGMWHLRPEYER